MQTPKSPFLIRTMRLLGARTPSSAPLSRAPSRTASIQASTRYCFESSHFINLKSNMETCLPRRRFSWGRLGSSRCRSISEMDTLWCSFRWGREESGIIAAPLTTRSRETTPIDAPFSGTGSVCTPIGLAP